MVDMLVIHRRVIVRYAAGNKQYLLKVSANGAWRMWYIIPEGVSVGWVDGNLHHLRFADDRKLCWAINDATRSFIEHKRVYKMRDWVRGRLS